jgi:hypothetical protein
MNRKGITVCAFSPADYRAAVVEMRPEKHYIPVFVFNNPGIVNSGYRVGDVIPSEYGVPVISLYKGVFSVHVLMVSQKVRFRRQSKKLQIQGTQILRNEAYLLYAAVTKDAAQHRSWTFYEAVMSCNLIIINAQFFLTGACRACPVPIHRDCGEHHLAVS